MYFLFNFGKAFIFPAGMIWHNKIENKKRVRSRLMKNQNKAIMS